MHRLGKYSKGPYVLFSAWQTSSASRLLRQGSVTYNQEAFIALRPLAQPHVGSAVFHRLLRLAEFFIHQRLKSFSASSSVCFGSRYGLLLCLRHARLPPIEPRCTNRRSLRRGEATSHLIVFSTVH